MSSPAPQASTLVRLDIDLLCGERADLLSEHEQVNSQQVGLTIGVVSGRYEPNSSWSSHSV